MATSTTTTSSSFANVRTIPVDIEHAGIRIALPLVMLGIGVGLWIGLSDPINAFIIAATGIDGLGSVGSAVIGMFGAILAGVVADYLFKRYWPSGRALTVNPGALMLRDSRRGHEDSTAIQFDQRINPILWRFSIKRSTPKAQAGWIMLAIQLSQDDSTLVIYSFLPPKRAQAMRLFGLFTSLLSAREMTKTKLGVRETAEQRRLMKCETTRAENGAELRPDDFLSVLEMLHPHVTEWKARLDS